MRLAYLVPFLSYNELFVNLPHLHLAPRWNSPRSIFGIRKQSSCIGYGVRIVCVILRLAVVTDTRTQTHDDNN